MEKILVSQKYKELNKYWKVLVLYLAFQSIIYLEVAVIVNWL